MTKPTIADILHLAADKYLAENEEQEIFSKERWSCCAVQSALNELVVEEFLYKDGTRKFSRWNASKTPTGKRVFKGLRNLGLSTGSQRMFAEFEFNKYGRSEPTPESQAARYAWLKFAAMIAEEQGV